MVQNMKQRALNFVYGPTSKQKSWNDDMIPDLLFSIVLLQKVPTDLKVIAWLINPQTPSSTYTLCHNPSDATSKQTSPTNWGSFVQHLSLFSSYPQFSSNFSSEECTKKCEDLRRQNKKALLDADNLATASTEGLLKLTIKLTMGKVWS